MSKSEERLRRQTLKKIKNSESNTRLAQSIVTSENPIHLPTKPNIKYPKSDIDALAYLRYAFHWDLEHADRDGLWSWGETREWSEEEHAGIIEPHFKSLENNSWKSVEELTYSGAGKTRRVLNKYQHVNTLCEEAQLRWIEHWENREVLYDIENLFRLRLGSNRRIWGVRIQHYYFMVWYERNHLIYKIKK